MSRCAEYHFEIIPTLLEDELKLRGISVRSLGNPASSNYIGLSDKTIQRGLKNGWMTHKTLTALSDIIDIERFVIEPDYEDFKTWTSEINHLRAENEKLKKDIFQLNILVTKMNQILKKYTLEL